MSALPLYTPFIPIMDLTANGLNGGKVYIGVANEDPQTNPQAVYWDAAATLPATQPLDVEGGYIMRLGTPTLAFTANPYSIRVLDRSGSQVFYKASVFSFATQDQITPTYATLAIATAASIITGTAWVQTMGYASAGDGGGAVYMPAAAGAGIGKFQSADGQWWKYTPESRGVNVLAFGAKGDDSTNDTTAINNACTFATALGSVLVIPPRSYKYTGPLTLTPSIVGVDALGASFYSTGSSTDAILFSGDGVGGGGTNITGQFNLPNCYGYTSGAGIHIRGIAGASIFVDVIEGCQDGVLVETTAAIPDTLNNTINFMWLFSNTQAGIHLKMGTDGTAGHQSLQGLIMSGNFVNGNFRGVLVDCPANQIQGCNDIDLSVGALDGDTNAGAIGLYCPTGILNGPFFLRAETFIGGNPGGDVVIPGGCNGITVLGGWAANTGPGYGSITGPGVGNVFRNTYPQPANFLSPPAAQTASNTRAAFNGGVAVGANELNVSLDLSAGMAAGDLKTFYAYSPFTSGYDAIEFSQVTYLPVIVSAVEDNTVSADYMGAGPIPNQISIRAYAIATFAPFAPDVTACRVTMQVGG